MTFTIGRIEFAPRTNVAQFPNNSDIGAPHVPLADPVPFATDECRCPACTAKCERPRGGFTDANGRDVAGGDPIEYRFGARRGVLVEALQDGDAVVRWSSGGDVATVKWCHLCKVPDWALPPIQAITDAPSLVPDYSDEVTAEHVERIDALLRPEFDGAEWQTVESEATPRRPLCCDPTATVTCGDCPFSSRTHPVTPPDDLVNPKTLVGARKIDLSLLPPAGMIHGAHAMMDGARKYGPYNWREKKVPARTYIAAAQRHLADFLDGEENADDSGVHHLGHVIGCCAIVLDAMETGNLIDDRPEPGAAARILARLEAAIKARRAAE